MSIRLSKKYGVNTTMGICFYCKEPNGELAMLGQLKGDVKAPKYSILHYRPCDKCEARMAEGITVIEGSMHDSYGNMPISKNELGEAVYPTGRWCVVKKDAAKQIFNIDLDNIPRIVLDTEVYNRIIPIEEL